jgi:hypothetical protein
MSSGAISAARLLGRGLRRYGVPLLLVVTVAAVPGTVLPEREPSPPRDEFSFDGETWSTDPIGPPRSAPDEPEPDPELVSANESPTTTSESSAPVVGALTASGIPEIALRAYRAAQATLAVTDPGCGLRWSLVAAIGRVESNHGRYGGAQLRADGTGTRPIRGIPLDGRPGAATIHDTDDGALDGDRVFDRAVGPMQFIPSSWRFAAADGNGDGLTDPDNIFDAALAAGGYLCAGETDLRDPSQRASAVFRYNRSDEYVALVLALADQYEQGVTPLPSVPGAPAPPPPLPSPVLPPASVTPPPFGREPGPASPSTGSTTTSSSSTSTTTTSSTTTTTAPCPTTTTTTTTVPSDPSSTTTTSTTTTTTTTVDPEPTSTSAPSTTVPGCPDPTTTTAPASTTTSSTPVDGAALLGGLVLLPLCVAYRARRREHRRA